jgi:hypothetical protein
MRRRFIAAAAIGMSPFDRSAFATTNGPIIRTILPARRIQIVTSYSHDVDAALDEQAARFDVPRTHVIQFELAQRWANAPRPLTAVYLFERDATHAFVTDRPLDVPGPGHFHATAKRCQAAIFSLEQPLTLAPVTIVKPWGREHWYTGIEARGTSGVTDGRCTSPLSWVLAAAPRRLCGDAPLPLLKVLDPAPESVLGDLYFELHDTKQELYVVTRIDRRAWPDGCGAIRFGMNAARRAKYADDQRFRAAYLVAVRKYEAVRRSIDGLLDKKRAAACVQLDVPVPPVLMQRWLDELDPRLIEAERATRAAMDEFTGMRALREGDIVQLPCGLPHALQHGVRVIEVQTPTFERRILSFAQKVLTQDHWDTESAVKHMRLDCPAASEPRAFINEHDCTVERIGEFDRFGTRRVRLAPEARLTLPADLPYAVCIGVSGELSLGNTRIGPETACLVPGSATQRTLTNIGDADAVCLLSGPNL